ncbi:hypothetical protein GF376_04020 [Candidatus Peregrinibacteria bacterium]|nr:hypothetical protein [Candidatus Peregrinibacteria bacterium]
MTLEEIQKSTRKLSSADLVKGSQFTIAQVSPVITRPGTYRQREIELRVGDVITIIHDVYTEVFNFRVNNQSYSHFAEFDQMDYIIIENEE